MNNIKKILVHYLYYFFIIIFSFLYVLIAYAESVQPELIEVTTKNREKCVEYYTRNGTLYCSTKMTGASSFSADIINSEKQNIQFDDRVWKLAWGKKENNIITIEYVPWGDNINNWNELITSQFLSGIPANALPQQLAEIIVNDLRKNGFNPVVTFHKQNPDEVIFEFRIVEPANQTQDELQMIRKRKNGFYILHYVVKKSDMGKENREKWLDNFSKSSIRN